METISRKRRFDHAVPKCLLACAFSSRQFRQQKCNKAQDRSIGIVVSSAPVILESFAK